ncbi:MAG: dihydropteroate synthase [Candidatus Omnitrophota bacterium]|jgi:5-methyltetrahydrofolate corrinoid/iron sulfur protein methyltransferase|nr:dihydropteroate synthase [Candidatus Omnitrophota bacterium]
MFIIGERINGMFKDVAEAIKKKDKGTIQDLAKKQTVSGASALDVNVGPASANPKETMEWLVNAITEVSNLPLAIDTTKIDVMEAGLAACKSKAIINSANANEDKMNPLFELAKKYNASLIALTMDKAGIPKDADGRLELAMKIVAAYIEHGLDVSELYIDAVILPVNVAQDQAREVLRTIRESKLLADPAPKTILGLSNVSQGAPQKHKGIINRTFLTMALAAGLDAAIMDAADEKLVDAAITTDLLLEKQLYCDSYLEAYRKK